MRILTLDDVDYAWELESLLETTTEIEEVMEPCFYPGEEFWAYNPTQKTFDWIEEQDDNFDVIILGNNLGAGLAKAEHISKELLPLTIVVYHEGRTVDQRPYNQRGVYRFAARNLVAKEIAKMLTQ